MKARVEAPIRRSQGNMGSSNIRRKIKEITEEEFIETGWGLGFKLKK